MTAVFIVSDAPLYARGLAHLLALDGRLEVVGSSEEWDEAARRIRRLPGRPQAVLVDVHLNGSVPTLDGAFEETPVIALVASDDEEAIIRWAEAGVSGLLSRRATLDELVQTVEGVAGGAAVCGPEVSAALLRRVASGARRGTAPTGEPALTTREHEVIRLLERGLSNKEIASRLDIELATVKNHVHHILGKLNANRRGEAVAMLNQSRS